MVAHGYFSHTEPDGDTWVDYLSESRVAWYSTGEAIARDRYPTPGVLGRDRPQGVDRLGTASCLALSTAFNDVGLGLAVSRQQYHYWTAVFIKGPDHTTSVGRSPKAPSLGPALGPALRTVGLAWNAGDPQLQALTSGLRDVESSGDRSGDWRSAWLDDGADRRGARRASAIATTGAGAPATRPGMSATGAVRSSTPSLAPTIASTVAGVARLAV